MTDWVQNQVENYKALASQTDKYTKTIKFSFPFASTVPDSCST